MSSSWMGCTASTGRRNCRESRGTDFSATSDLNADGGAAAEARYFSASAKPDGRNSPGGGATAEARCFSASAKPEAGSADTGLRRGSLQK